MSGTSPRRLTALYSGIKALIACDSGAVVTGIVGFVVSQHAGLRLLTRLLEHRRARPIAVALILLNGIRCYVGVRPSGHGSAVMAARRPNERRAAADFKAMAPDCEWTDLVFTWRLPSTVQALARISCAAAVDWRRSVRLARLLNRRLGTFRALRVMELIAYYRRYSELLAARRFDLAVMSSHSNPWGIALNLAARRHGVPIALVTHGMPVRPLARLDYDLAVIECEASKPIYRDAGCRMGLVVVKGRRRNYSPMRLPMPAARIRVGVFLSKDPVEDRVVSCVRALVADARIGAVFVRPHPVNLWTGLARCIRAVGDRRVSVLSGRSLEADLRECDLVLAGNSTVLLDAVVAGCPAGYVRGFDHGPYDVQDFLRDGVIHEVDPQASIDPDDVAGFYLREGWHAVLRRYADVDRGDADVARTVRQAVRQLSGVTARTRGAA